ncbi:MAG: sigma-E factor negative regulatory protein [Azoarcus sp.]|jgi:sigma-E factor negative regulatory protein RseA|nr:sigma-E factor negative regulatory protein [Azoarcus sp.]
MKEKLSAMLDGNLDDVMARALFIRLKHDTAFREEWDTYCLVGDFIRGYAPPELEGFTERVMARLEKEPTILVPSGKENKNSASTARHFWHHRLLPLAASVMGILAVGGVMAVLSRDAPAPAALSVQVVEAPATVPAPAHPMKDGARYEYLVAHQALAGGPMPAAVQYVRTVSVPLEE